MAMLLRGGQVLDGSTGTLDTRDVLTEDDTIKGVGPRLTAAAGTGGLDAHHARPAPCRR